MSQATRFETSESRTETEPPTVETPAVAGRLIERSGVERAEERLEGLDGVFHAGLTGSGEIPVAINLDEATINDVRRAGLILETDRTLGPSVIEINEQLNVSQWNGLLAQSEHWVTGFVTGLAE